MAATFGVGPTTSHAAGSGTTLTLTLTGTTIGRSIVVGGSWQSTAGVSSITCTGESNLTVDKLQPSTWSACIASLINNTTGGDKTITITIASGAFQRDMWAVEVSPISGVDATAGGTASTANPSINLTTLSDTAAIFAHVICSNTGGIPTAGGAYTGITVTSATNAFGEYDLDGGAQGLRAVDMTKATADFWVMAAASYVFSDPNVSRTPPVGALTLTGAASTVNATSSAVPTVGALTLTGAAPLTFAGQLIIGSAGALTLSGIAPTLALSNSDITPTVGALTLAGIAPSVSVSTDGIPVGTLTLTGIAPSVVKSAQPEWLAWSAEGLLIQGSLAEGGFVNWRRWTAESTLSSPYALSAAVEWEPWTARGDFPLAAAVEFVPWTATGRVIELLRGAGEWSAWKRYTSSGAVSWKKWTAQGTLTAELSEVYTTTVMNTRNTAVTKYTNYEFNSFAKIGDSYYGAGPAGLVRLDGETDRDSNIDWRIKTGQLTGDSSVLKRLPEILASLRSNGPVRVRVWKNDREYHDYMLPPIKPDTIHQHRVTPGKGMRSKYYMIELQGVSNSTLELDSLLINMTDTTRRLG